MTNEITRLMHNLLRTDHQDAGHRHPHLHFLVVADPDLQPVSRLLDHSAIQSGLSEGDQHRGQPAVLHKQLYDFLKFNFIEMIL